MTDKSKLQWEDVTGKEIPNGAQVALLATVVGRHGGGRVSVECIPGQRIILPGKMCDQGKATGKQALKEASGRLDAEVKNSAALQKRLDDTLAQLAGVREEFQAYIASQGKAKGG